MNKKCPFCGSNARELVNKNQYNSTTYLNCSLDIFGFNEKSDCPLSNIALPSYIWNKRYLDSNITARKEQIEIWEAEQKAIEIWEAEQKAIDSLDSKSFFDEMNKI